MIPFLRLKTQDSRLRTPAEAGQALVEFALILPFLVLMLCGVVYCGGLVVAEQNLAMTARHAARSMALEATRKGLESRVGGGGVANPSVGKSAMADAWPGADLTLKGVSWGNIGAQGRGNAGMYAKRDRMTPQGLGRQVGMGIGVAFYGATVDKDLGRDLSPIGRVAANMMPSGGLSGRLLPSLSASAVMPAELPIRKGSATTAIDGVLDMNPWIPAIVSRPVKVKTFD